MLAIVVHPRRALLPDATIPTVVGVPLAVPGAIVPPGLHREAHRRSCGRQAWPLGAVAPWITASTSAATERPE